MDSKNDNGNERSEVMNSSSAALKRVGIGYLRVSTVGQADGASLDTQQEHILRFAEGNNIKIVEWFCDPGVSAKTANRPGIKKAMKYVEQHRGKIDYFVVYNMTRASRDIESCYRFIAGPLKDNGVRVLDSTLPFTENGNDAASIIMQNMSLLTGEIDNRQKSTTVKDNMRSVAKEGWWLTSAPLGFKIKKVPLGIRDNQGKMRTHSTLEPDGEIAEKMARLLTRFSEGDMTEADAHRMAYEIGLKSKKGKPLSASTVSLYLRMPVYAGFQQHESLLGDELVKLQSEGLISWETYEKNQRILRHNTVEHTPSNNELYPLKGLLRCSLCGSVLRGSAPGSGSHKPSPRYHCKNKGHASMPIDAAHDMFCTLLDNIAPTEATVKLFKEIVKRTAKQQYDEINKSLADLQTKREQVTSRLNKICDEYLDSNISLEEKNTHTHRLEGERNTLDDQISDLKDAQRLSEATINYVCNFLSMPAKLWRDANLECRQTLQAIIFPKGLPIDLCHEKYGTVELGPLFSVISTKNGLLDPSNDNVVVPTGIEPVTLGL